MTDEADNDRTPNLPETRLEELERTCFVIMPFGKKDVAGKQVDFTAIYKNIFEPAINDAQTPEGKPLVAARTDMDAFSSSIDQEMFEYITYSRLAFADISGFNPNVFYEIGARHAIQESGTVLFRQTGHAIPFDINSIKIFEYDHKPKSNAKQSREFITSVLSESLKRNRLDSPVRLALRSQWTGAPSVSLASTGAAEASTPSERPATGLSVAIEGFMRDAEEATRLGDTELAGNNYWAALRLDRLNIIARMRLALILKNQGEHYAALEEFMTITKLAPDYGEAWKEKGVVEGLISRAIAKDKRPKWLPDGIRSLERATKLIPDDFDAWASLGGVLKNVHSDYTAAHEKYAHAADISDNHPYPLLNAIKLEAMASGKLNLKPYQEKLQAAEALRLAQTRAEPPSSTPWSFFDVAEIRLYQKDHDGFLKYVREGISHCNAGWQPRTFRDSLASALMDDDVNLAGLSGLEDGIALLDDAAKKLAEKAT